MKILEQFSVYIIPSMIFFIVSLGFIKKVAMFDAFLAGAKEGFNSTISILPSLVGLITAVTMLRSSGALDIFSKIFEPVAKLLSFPKEVFPLALLRPISGSGSLAFIDRIFSDYGVDSFAGRVASVMMGSTETTFYAIAVYFGAVKIKNTRHSVPSALIADFAGFIMSVLSVRMFFYAFR